MSCFESLESRRLFAVTFSIVADTLTVKGSDGADDIVVTNDAGKLVIKDAGVVKKTYAAGAFTQLVVDAAGGADKIRSFGVPGWIAEPTFRGGSGNDEIRGSGEMETIDGGTGADRMYGGLHTTADYSTRTAKLTFDLNTPNGDGAAGENDHVDPTVGKIKCGSGDDKIIGHLVGITSVIGAENTFWGGDGNDTLIGNAGFDQLFGGRGNDTLRPGPGEGHADGEDGNDILEGGDGPNTFNGGAGDDKLVGGPDNDLLIGGDGADDIRGGGGTDTVDYSASPAGVTVTLDNVANDGRSLPGFRLPGPFGAGRWIPGWSERDNVHDDVEEVIGSDYSDSLTGSDGGDEVITGGGGNDRIFGLGGADRLDGGAGNDTIDGGAGHDELVGGDGNDTLYARDGSYFERVYGNNADGTGSGYDRAQVDRVTMYFNTGSFPLIVDSASDIDEFF